MPLLTYLLAEDIVYRHIFPRLEISDLINLKVAMRDCADMVNCYISRMKYIDWDNLPVGTLPEIASTSKNVRHVDISPSMWVDDQQMSTILSRNTKIETLILRDCTQLSLAGVQPIVGLKNLIALCVRKNCWVNNHFIHIVTSHLNCIREIDLSMCLMGDSSMIPFFKKFTRLNNVDLEDCPLVTDKSISVMGHYCRELVNLNVAWNKQIGDQSLSVVVSNCPNLIALKIAGCDRVSRIFSLAVGKIYVCE